MKRLAMIIVLSTGMIAGPAMADHSNILNRENIGGAIGAAIGGFAGSKIVKGKGRPAATAAGAVGGWLLGKNVAHNYGSRPYYDDAYAAPRHTSSYGYSGGYQPSSSYVPAKRYKPARSYKPSGCCDYDRGHEHGIQPIHATYVAKCRSNVRSGPGTRYHVIDQLYDHEQVRVIGKVNGRDWYQVKVGHRVGYVYAPLLRPTRYGYSDY